MRYGWRMADDLDTTLEGLKRLRERITDAIDAMEALIEERRKTPGDVQVVTPPPASRRRRHDRSLRDEVLDLLREAHRPMTAREIADVLGGRGDPRIKLDRRDPSSPVRTALQAALGAKQVETGGGKWWIPSAHSLYLSPGGVDAARFRIQRSFGPAQTEGDG